MKHINSLDNLIYHITCIETAKDREITHDIFNHGRRTAYYAHQIGKKLKLTKNELNITVTSALWHDIGKTSVASEIILKSGFLSTTEWGIMKTHPEKALHLLEHIKCFKSALPAILHHHEYFDGSGYPDKLTGKNIPLFSRIISLADTWDTICSKRAYKKAHSIKFALNEILLASGSQFDPQITDIFIKLLQKYYKINAYNRRKVSNKIY